MDPEAAKVVCRTPTPGAKPTRIDAWKFETIRSAILACVPGNGDGTLLVELPGLVTEQLTAADRERVGSVGWYTTTVKLELEVRGELERLKDVKPQRLRKLQC